MEDVRIGIWVRTARLRLGMRQVDLARIAGVSAAGVSRFERGDFERMTLGTCRAIAGAVGIELHLVPRSIRLPDLERQVSRRHAAIVEELARRLSDAGWEVTTEYSFNHFGDRGSVDVLAWRPEERALLIVEAKSELRDLQATLRAIDVKKRVVPLRFAAERGVRPRTVGVVLALPDISTERAVVGRHRATFAAALPARSVEVRRWIGTPGEDLRGVWFLPVSRGALLTQRYRGRQRVRVAGSAVAVPIVPDVEAISLVGRAEPVS